MNKDSAVWVVGLALSIAVGDSNAALFSSCDDASDQPKPGWVSRSDYSIPDHYVGVGIASAGGRSKEERIKAADDNAKSNLVQQIEVTIKAENQQVTEVTNDKVKSHAFSKVTVSAEEVLRGLAVKDRWVDVSTCTHYSLLTISHAAIAQAKQEKLMKFRLEQYKKELAEGTDIGKNRDINLRKKHLEEAKVWLADTNFAFLLEELSKDVYLKKLEEAFVELDKEASRAQGRMALFALNHSNVLSPTLVGKMLDQLRPDEAGADRLIAECSSEEECLTRAKERGFAKLTLLTAKTQISTSQMGAVKGTLSVSRTIYDLESRKVISGPDVATAQVIGWGSSDLDWSLASDKTMSTLK